MRTVTIACYDSDEELVFGHGADGSYGDAGGMPIRKTSPGGAPLSLFDV